MLLNFAQLTPREISGYDLPAKTICLSITRSVNELGEGNPDFVLTSAHVMACVQRAWRLNHEKADKSSRILATYSDPNRGRIILGIFEFGRDGMDKCFHKDPDEEDRYSFLAKPAPAADWNKYVGHYLAKSKAGETNPVRYYNTEYE